MEQNQTMSSVISANGISINYRFDGPEDGPVVMFSNSLISNYTMWDDQVEVITSVGYRMLRYDARGHGGTDAPDTPYSITMFAAYVKRFRINNELLAPQILYTLVAAAASSVVVVSDWVFFIIILMVILCLIELRALTYLSDDFGTKWFAGL